MSTNQEEIARLQAILASGASSVTADGITTSYDLDVIRSRLRDLQNQDAQAHANGTARPKIARLDLRSCW